MAAVIAKGRFGNVVLTWRPRTALTHDSQQILQLRDNSLGASEAVPSGRRVGFRVWRFQGHDQSVTKKNKAGGLWICLWGRNNRMGHVQMPAREAVMPLAAQILWQGAQCHNY